MREESNKIETELR